MSHENIEAPDSTAVRVALWRALHVQLDAPPLIHEDSIGLQLAAPDADWHQRPDMDPQATRGYRAAIVGRARFIEDLVMEQLRCGIAQYIVLGAGLDTFAQRRPKSASQMRIFEIDRPGPQAWKRRRLMELGFGLPEWLRLVPVDFEEDVSWPQQLAAAGFDASRPAVISATGLSLYLTKNAIAVMLRQVAMLASGSTLAMTFILPPELLESEDRVRLQTVQTAARGAGTPFRSFFKPSEMLALARAAGFAHAEHVSASDLIQRYFVGRSDGFCPSSGEAFLIATTA